METLIEHSVNGRSDHGSRRFTAITDLPIQL